MRINTKVLSALKLHIQEAFKAYMCILMGDEVGGKANEGERKKSVNIWKKKGIKHTASDR